MAGSKDIGGSTGFTAREVQAADGGSRVYALAGVFTNCPPAYDFLNHLRAELGDIQGGVILDLTEVIHMTSGGVGMLAALFMAAREAGCPMFITGMHSRLTSIMKVTGLAPVIPSRETMDDALAAVKEARQASGG